MAEFELVSVGLRRPPGISKSLVRAMGCETYLTSQYLQPGMRQFGEMHWLGRTGTEFHAWRNAYVAHLAETDQSNDPAYAGAYLSEHPEVSADAQTLIRADAVKLHIDPATIYGSELFLSMDRRFKPLEREFGRTPGKPSDHPDCLVSGQLDLLLIDNRTATIVDPKSGFSTVGVADAEPPIYAALVMAHFRKIEEVKFIWDFVRVKASKRTSYTRDDLGWIHSQILEFEAAFTDAIRRYNAGETVGTNPFAGLCPYCMVNCSMRPKFEAGELAIGPLQTRYDFLRIARGLQACESFINKARPLARTWLDQAPDGREDLGNDWEAVVQTSSIQSYPLLDALDILGLAVVPKDGAHPLIQQMMREQRPAYTPRFDVPLSALTVGGLAHFAKTKKSRKRPDGGGISRASMKDELGSIAEHDASSRVVIRKSTRAPELSELLEQSIQQLTNGGTGGSG